MAEEFTIGEKDVNMRENIKMIISMASDAIPGQMDENILDNGKIIKDMDVQN